LEANRHRSPAVVQQARDVRELELLLLAPDDLAAVRFEVAARFADVQECTGSVRVRHQGPWTSRGTFGELRVGDRVAFDVVPTAHFWLRLHCASQP
jgi:hypothetical protein